MTTPSGAENLKIPSPTAIDLSDFSEGESGGPNECIPLIVLSSPGGLSSYIGQPERLGYPHPVGIDCIRCAETYTRPYTFDVDMGGKHA